MNVKADAQYKESDEELPKIEDFRGTTQNLSDFIIDLRHQGGIKAGELVIVSAKTGAGRSVLGMDYSSLELRVLAMMEKEFQLEN